MADIKFSSNLFLESQELNRFKNLLVNDGYKQQLLLNTNSFGILKTYNLPDGTNKEFKDSFFVDNIGSTSNSLNIRSGRAIDKFANILTLNEDKTLQIPVNGLWYWIKIKHKLISEEIGTVNIDVNGNLSGVGTMFSNVLRGQPNFPSKIKFTGSTANNLEYEVVDVISNTSALISGDFTAETNLKYSIVGTFTPGYVPPNNDKFIFQYDDVEISIIQESTSTIGVPPIKLENEEFYIARVRTKGLNLEIQDKRTEFWLTHSQYYIQSIVRNANPIIGCESVKWDVATTARDRNEVNISWGFRTENWSVDTTQNIITINSGLGGILKENDLTFFNNEMFNGWRVYTESGRYYKIVSSTKVGTQLNLKLENLNFEHFPSNSLLHIVQDVDEVEIYAKSNILIAENKIIEEKFTFPVNTLTAKCYVRIVNDTNTYLYNFVYRLKKNSEYTQWFSFPNNSIGYYNEQSFDNNGVLEKTVSKHVKVPYIGSLTAGFITITPNPDNINIKFNNIILGDKFGVDYKDIKVTSLHLPLIVGEDRQIQYLKFNNITLNNDLNIEVKKVRSDGTPCINGNRFIIHLIGNISLNGKNIRFVTDYKDAANYTIIRDIDVRFVNIINKLYNSSLNKDGLIFMFNYDGTAWVASSIMNDLMPFSSIIMYGGANTQFDSTGLGVNLNVLGWALCNGNYGTQNLRGLITAGYSDDNTSEYNAQHAIRGSDTYQLSTLNLPKHNHDLSNAKTDNSGQHFHGIKTSQSDGASDTVRRGGQWDNTQSAKAQDADTSGNPVIHEHKLIGFTGDAGSDNPVKIDVRQRFKVMLYIQKIV